MSTILTYQQYRDSWIATCANPERARRGTTGQQHHKNYMEYVKYQRTVAHKGDRVVVSLKGKEVARGTLHTSPWVGHTGVLLDEGLHPDTVRMNIVATNDAPTARALDTSYFGYNRKIVFPPYFTIQKEN